jgi:hypothetical protein
VHGLQNISPNGVAFADKGMRPGALPRMLSEILDTRVMIKGAMKRLGKGDRVSFQSAIDSEPQWEILAELMRHPSSSLLILQILSHN